MTPADVIRAVEQAGGSLEVRNGRLRYRLPAQMAPALVEELRRHKPDIIVALGQPVCDCGRLRNGQPVHRAGCPIVAEMEKQPFGAWLEEQTPVPVDDAVSALLKPGEYIDERGVIRRAS